MAKKRSVSPRNRRQGKDRFREEEFHCKCALCLLESSNGCYLGSSSTFYAHQRQEKLRSRLDTQALDDLDQATTFRATGLLASNIPQSRPFTSILHNYLNEGPQILRHRKKKSNHRPKHNK